MYGPLTSPSSINPYPILVSQKLDQTIKARQLAYNFPHGCNPFRRPPFSPCPISICLNEPPLCLAPPLTVAFYTTFFLVFCSTMKSRWESWDNTLLLSLPEAWQRYHPSDDAFIRCLSDILKFPGQAYIFPIVGALDGCSKTQSPCHRLVTKSWTSSSHQNFPHPCVCITSRARCPGYA